MIILMNVWSFIKFLHFNINDLILDQKNEDMKQRITNFVNIAKDLEMYIVNKQLEKPTLEQEVMMLRKELNQKNQLIEECKQKIIEWSNTFNLLQEKQKNLLYEDIIEPEQHEVIINE